MTFLSGLPVVLPLIAYLSVNNRTRCLADFLSCSSEGNDTFSIISRVPTLIVEGSNEPDVLPIFFSRFLVVSHGLVEVIIRYNYIIR